MKIVQQEFGHFFAIAEKHIICDRYIDLFLRPAMTAGTLIPVDDSVDIAELSQYWVVHIARRTAGTSVQIQQNGSILILTLDIDPLLCAVDVYIHRLVDAAIGRSVIDLPSNGPDDKEQNDDRNKDDQYPL